MNTINAMNYNKLPVNQRAEILWAKGKFIEAIELNDFDISLYTLDDNFFEMHYSVNFNRIERITHLTHPNLFGKL